MDQDVSNTALGGGWWRWPLVPIGSILLAAIGSIAVVTLQGIAVGLTGGMTTGGWFDLLVYPLIPSAMFGYLLGVRPASSRRAIGRRQVSPWRRS